MPVLIVHGMADPRPAWPAQQLAGILPLATLHLLPDMGHYPWLEGEQAFRAVIRSFLADK
jgi:pimeloyl-ACP methyl ester carboxylesterase